MSTETHGIPTEDSAIQDLLNDIPDAEFTEEEIETSFVQDRLTVAGAKKPGRVHLAVGGQLIAFYEGMRQPAAFENPILMWRLYSDKTVRFYSAAWADLVDKLERFCDCKTSSGLPYPSEPVLLRLTYKGEETLPGKRNSIQRFDVVKLTPKPGRRN